MHHMQEKVICCFSQKPKVPVKIHKDTGVLVSYIIQSVLHVSSETDTGSSRPGYGDELVYTLVLFGVAL